jgi:hypothetical protein
MNVITLHTLHDVNSIVHDEPYISGKASAFDQETEHNMWCISIDDVLLRSITERDIVQFFDELISRRSQQLEKNNPQVPVTLYVWFDKQALQLRFNIISGKVEHLPFGCTVHKVDTLYAIVKDFLETTHDVAQHGDKIEIIEPGDEGWDDDDDDEVEYTLDVFVVTLNDNG